MMIDLRKYNEIILDFDGVVLDSNLIKKKAIKKVAQMYLDEERCKEFVEYFIGNNGLPREIKISKYFDEMHKQIVLNNYNVILDNQLNDASFTRNLLSFLNNLNYYNLKPHVLSGGDEEEIKTLLKKRKYFDKFQNIMGGPRTKYENLELLNLQGNILYIGDSKIDYEVAYRYGFDFIFMYGYTQFDEWKEFFKDKDIFMLIKDFSTFANCKC